MFKPAVDSIQPNGITFALRILTNPRASDTEEGTIVSMPGVFAMKTIGPRWAMHTYQQSPQNQGGGYDETPWEPYNYPGNVNIYEDVYYTFTSDGRVKIDKFTPYQKNGSAAYIWEESINDGGWPSTWQNGQQVFAPVGQLFWGASGSIAGGSGIPSGIDAFREFLVFKQALTSDQLIAQENFYHPSNGQLASGMSPCNTGNWMNQKGTVATPCGPAGSGNIPAAPPNNVQGFNFNTDSIAPTLSVSTTSNGVALSVGPPPANPPLSLLENAGAPPPWAPFYPLTPTSYTTYVALANGSNIMSCQVQGSGLPGSLPTGTVIEVAYGANYPETSLNSPDSEATAVWVNPFYSSGSPTAPVTIPTGWSCTSQCENGSGGCVTPNPPGGPCNSGLCQNPPPPVGPCTNGLCQNPPPPGNPCQSGTGLCQNDSDLPTLVPAPQPGDQFNYSAGSSATFTVNAGSTTFTATQPNDSIATYVWMDGGGSPFEWLSSANGSSLGEKLEYVPVKNYTGVPSSATITVNAGTTFQTIDGFGGAMTDSAASLILNSPNRNSIMDNLFGTDVSGGGMTIVRSPMGSSDMMADPNDLHTYEDTSGSFSVMGHPSDNRQITALQQAKQLAGGNFKLLGTPWTAPAWMKRGGSLLPSSCGTQDNEFNTAFVQQYAQYFTSYINAYSSLGLTPWMVSMQNEPENCQTSMPTTLFSANDEVALAQAMRGKLPSGVKLLGWDHNWNDEGYVDTLVSNNSVDAIGYHCYNGTNYDDQTQAVPTYFTECTGFTTGTSDVATNLGWEVANNIMGPLRFGSRGSVYWSLAQDANGNPHYGGAAACKTCRGMITVNSDGSYFPSQDYYFWAQFSKFVAPGAVRIDSNNSGNLSTVAFHKGSTNVLVVLNSSSAQANGGSPGSGGSGGGDLRGHIVQWDGDTKPQKSAWLVGSDGYRRWISDGGTFNCLKFDAGMQGPDVEPSGTLDQFINLNNVWAVCGAVTMGTNSELELNTYLKSTNGARMTLTSGGLRTVDTTGTTRWAPGGSGNRLVLQEDQNLVLYSGNNQVWASNTAGSGAVFLSLRDDATFALFNKANQEVWKSPIQDASWYKGRIVQWDSDPAAQKSSWLVGLDQMRRWIPDLPTFQCLQGAGKGNSLSVSSDMLNLLPNLNNVWATCGGDKIGVQGTLESSTKLSAGSYTLVMQSDGNLVEYNNGTTVVWSTGTNGKGGAELELQSDGNLVMYDQNRHTVWAAGTNGTQPGELILGPDGTLKLFNASGAQIWSR